MYESIQRRRDSDSLQGLGISLKPPSWLRNAVRGVVSDTVNTATQAAKDAAARAAQDAANRLRPPQTAADQVNSAVAAIPGGWLTIAAVGLGALLLFKRRG